MNIKLKNNMKMPNLKNLSGKIGSEKSMWQKGLLGVSLVALVIFIGACVYLFVRPIDSNIKDVIEKEVNSTNITFDEKTLDNLKNRQIPTKSAAPTATKNPFMPF